MKLKINISNNGSVNLWQILSIKDLELMNNWH